MQAFRQRFCSVVLLFVPLCLASSQSFASTNIDSQYGPFWAGLTSTLRTVVFIDDFDVLLLGAHSSRLYTAYKRNGTYTAVNPEWFDVPLTGGPYGHTLYFPGLNTPLPPDVAGTWSVQAFFALQFTVYYPFPFGPTNMIACNVFNSEPCYDEASGLIN